MCNVGGHVVCVRQPLFLCFHSAITLAALTAPVLSVFLRKDADDDDADDWDGGIDAFLNGDAVPFDASDEDGDDAEEDAEGDDDDDVRPHPTLSYLVRIASGPGRQRGPSDSLLVFHFSV